MQGRFSITAIAVRILSLNALPVSFFGRNPVEKRWDEQRHAVQDQSKTAPESNRISNTSRFLLFHAAV
jgi:hypothetical protein